MSSGSSRKKRSVIERYRCLAGGGVECLYATKDDGPTTRIRRLTHIEISSSSSGKTSGRAKRQKLTVPYKPSVMPIQFPKPRPRCSCNILSNRHIRIPNLTDHLLAQVRPTCKKRTIDVSCTFESLLYLSLTNTVAFTDRTNPFTVGPRKLTAI